MLRILPQIEGLLQPQNPTAQLSDGQGIIGAPQSNGNSEATLEGSPTIGTSAPWSNSGTIGFPSPASGDTQSSQQYHVGQTFAQSPSINTFMGVPHHDSSGQSSSASPFLTQNNTIIHSAPTAAVNDNDSSPVSAADDGAEESQNETGDEYPSSYLPQGGTGADSRHLNLSFTLPNHAAQVPWIASAPRSATSTQHSQVYSQNEAQFTMHDLDGAQMDLSQSLGGYMMENQVLLTNQSMADVSGGSMPPHSFTTPHPEMNSMTFSNDMLFFEEDRVNSGNNVRFDASDSIGEY